MVKVIEKGSIKVRCNNCKSVLSADMEEVRQRNTSPPTWEIDCPVCCNIIDVTCCDGARGLTSKYIALNIDGAWEHSSFARSGIGKPW